MAAIVLRWSDPGFISKYGVGAHDLDKTMDVLRLRANKTVLQGSRFFRRASATGSYYKEADYGNGVELPRLSEDSGPMPYVSPVPGFPTTIYFYQYRLAIRVERSLVEQSLKGTIRTRMTGLLRSGRLLPEYGMANWLNNLTDATNYPGADGVAIASASHPHTRREQGVWSNIGTAAALSLASFSLARIQLRKRTDEFGYVNSQSPVLLQVPVELQQKALELKTAEFNPDTATNQPNVWRNDNWQPYIYDYQTDTNAWTLWGDRDESERGLIYVVGPSGDPTIAPLDGADKSTDIIWGQRLRMNVGFGAHVEAGLEYNVGA